MAPANFKIRWELPPQGCPFGSSCPTHSLSPGHLGTHASRTQHTAQTYLCPEELELCHPTAPSSTPNLHKSERRGSSSGHCSDATHAEEETSPVDVLCLWFYFGKHCLPDSGQEVNAHQNSALWSNWAKDTELGSVHGTAVFARTHPARGPKQETG